MQVSRQNKDKHTVVLTIKAGQAELEPIRQHVVSHFVREVKIPGFREGKAPLALVEKHVDQQRFMDEFMNHAVNDMYGRALAQEKLRVVTPPQIEVKKIVPYTDLEFTATVTIVNIAKLVDYKKLKVEKVKSSVTAKDVDEVVKQLRLRSAQRTATGEPAKNGNEVIIDFGGKDSKGRPVSGAQGESVPLLLGSSTFIPGFEDNLVGMKAGDKKTFDLTFPKDYGVRGLQGQKVTFDVTVKSVNVLYQKDNDDAFAAAVSPFKKLDDLKADIKKQLAVERQNQADRDTEGRIVGQLIEKSQLEVPSALVEQEIDRMEEDEKRNLAARGQTWQEHLDQEKITATEHRERHRPDAERNLKVGILLGEVAEREGVDVTPEELSIRLQILKGQNPDPAAQAELDNPEVQRGLRSRMLTEKTLAKLRDYATKS